MQDTFILRKMIMENFLRAKGDNLYFKMANERIIKAYAEMVATSSLIWR